MGCDQPEHESGKGNCANATAALTAGNAAAEHFWQMWTRSVQQAGTAADLLAEELRIGMGSTDRLEELSQKFDLFLRSPDFLTAMKQQLDTLVLARQKSGRAGATPTAENASPSVDTVPEPLTIRQRIANLERRITSLEEGRKASRIP